MWQVTQRTRDMQSDDTRHSIIAPFPPSVYMFRGCSVTNVPCCWCKHNRELQTLLETGLLLCTITHCAPRTAAVLHCDILLYVMGFDSTYCMLWVGKSCLVCSSSDLCPGHSYHLHLTWHLADVQSMPALCEGNRLESSQWEEGQSSRNEPLVPGQSHVCGKLLQSTHTKLLSSTTLNSPSLLLPCCRGINLTVCFNCPSIQRCRKIFGLLHVIWTYSWKEKADNEALPYPIL